MQYTEIFEVVKTKIFSRKNLIFYLFLLKTLIELYMLELPHQGGSNEYPQSLFWITKKKNSIPLHTPVLLYKTGVLREFSLHAHVFLMLAGLIKRRFKYDKYIY